MSEALYLPNNARRQPVLDAVIELQGRRRAAVAALEAGRPRTGARIAATGGDLSSWMMRESKSWRHLLSTRPRTSGAQLSVSIVNNRALVDSGLTMESLFDFEGTDPAARALLESEGNGSYYYGYAPVQMRLVDHREVLLHGPPVAEGDSILSLTDPGALAAARGYWQAVMESAVPCRVAVPHDDALTARQRQVLELLRHDLSDERIAAAIGVSVRTVRYEVAAVIEIFGVRTRFAAGYAYARARSTA